MHSQVIDEIFVPKGVYWNGYRKHYDTLTFEDLIFINEKIDKLYPKQMFFHRKELEKAFDLLPDETRIIELGCHNGALADCTLLKYKNIKSWLGYDFETPIKRTIVKDPRYSTHALFDWFHETWLPDFDVFISSHTLEHLSNIQAEQTLRHVRHARYVLLEVPLTEEGQSWNKFGCTHVLTWGLKDIRNLLNGLGYKIIFENTKFGIMLGRK